MDKKDAAMIAVAGSGLFIACCAAAAVVELKQQHHHDDKEAQNWHDLIMLQLDALKTEMRETMVNTEQKDRVFKLRIEAQIEEIRRFEERLPKLEHENKVDIIIKEEMGRFLTQMETLYEAEIRRITDEQTRLSARLETGLHQNAAEIKQNTEKMEATQNEFIQAINSEIEQIKSRLFIFDKHKMAITPTQSKQTSPPSVGQKRWL